jgi:DNA-binding MarR family transcriptional regulator
MSRRNLESGVADLTQAIGQLIRRLRAIGGTHELSWSQTMVMSRLAKEGPATTADLARAEGVKPQSMGATIAALEEVGMVARRPHPTDGRQFNIELTAKGAAVRTTAKDAKQTWLTKAIAALDDKERDTLFAAGEIIKRLVDHDPS